MQNARNRYGELFSEGDEVFVYHGYHKVMEGRVFVIKEITPFDACESGFMVQLIDKESGNLLKRKLDTNWIFKTNKN